MTLHEEIRSRRKKAGLTQKELSVLCGISSSFLCDIEIGRTSPSLKTLAKIAKALKIETKDLL